MFDASANLYGITEGGGDLSECGGVGCGVVFRVNKKGKETVLHSFSGTGGDGQQPGSVTLIRDSTGNLYGTTILGGDLNFGTVFKVNKKGKETVLYSFQGFLDGGYPYTGLVQDAKGYLYGITNAWGRVGYGTLFQVKAAGELTVLRAFNQLGGWDAATPLVMDAMGNFYSALAYGGNYHYLCYNDYGCGVVSKLVP